MISLALKKKKRRKKMKNELLKKLREDKSLSQDALAKKIDVSQSTLSSWELGINYPRTVDLEKICLELETTPNILLGFTEYNDDLVRELFNANQLIENLKLENQKLRLLIGNMTIEKELGI